MDQVEKYDFGGEPASQCSLQQHSVPVKEGIHTAMETVDLPQRTISWNSKAADLLLYDIKLINNEMHKKKQVLEMT